MNLTREEYDNERQRGEYADEDDVQLRTRIGVMAAVEHLRSIAGDAEAAHGLEDWIHQTVIANIADGSCTHPRECARIALTTREIKFARWCA